MSRRQPTSGTQSDAETAELSRAADALFNAMRRSRAATLNGRLTSAQAALLTPLLLADELSVGALATQAGVSVPTATRMLHPLEAKALVRRIRSVRDERVVLVALTADGRHELDAATSQLREQQAGVFGQFSPADRLHLLRLLPALADAIARSH